MSLYDVNWSDDASDELAAIWIGAADRDAVRFIADYIEFQLHIDAHAKGIVVSSEGLRKFARAPLAVIYEYDRDLQIVTIVKVSEYH